MKATATTRKAKDFLEVIRHDEGGVTYKCLKCGLVKEANAYYEADHEAWIDHVAQCGGNLQELAQAQAQEPATPILLPALLNGHTEAPASFNVKAISPQGFDIMLTLRANDTGELLGRIEKALAWLIKHKFTPTSARSSGGGANGPSANSGNGKQKYCTEKRDDPGFCPVHGKEMKRSQHHPGYYCPTKV